MELNDMKGNLSVRRLLLAVSLVLFAGHPLSAEEKTMLVVWATDGSKASYALTEHPKVTFTETSFVVTLHGEATNYPLNDVARITYESLQGTSISELWHNETPFTVSGNYLLFSTLQAGSTVAVYTAGGVLVQQESIVQDGSYAFPLPDITAGGYMVSINGVTYKFLKR